MDENKEYNFIVGGRNAGKIAFLREELENRFTYHYMQTDGSYDFPNSLEGDLLKMTHEMLQLQKEADQEKEKPLISKEKKNYITVDKESYLNKRNNAMNKMLDEYMKISEENELFKIINNSVENLYVIVRNEDNEEDFIKSNIKALKALYRKQAVKYIIAVNESILGKIDFVKFKKAVEANELGETKVIISNKIPESPFLRSWVIREDDLRKSSRETKENIVRQYSKTEIEVLCGFIKQGDIKKIELGKGVSKEEMLSKLAEHLRMMMQPTKDYNKTNIVVRSDGVTAIIKRSLWEYVYEVIQNPFYGYSKSIMESIQIVDQFSEKEELENLQMILIDKNALREYNNYEFTLSPFLPVAAIFADYQNENVFNDEMIKKINEVQGFELDQWQINYLKGAVYMPQRRAAGKTYICIVKHLLESTEPLELDITNINQFLDEPEKVKHRVEFISRQQYIKSIYDELNANGLKTRYVKFEGD